MTTIELIAFYRQQAETNPGLTLENIESAIAGPKGCRERLAALTSLRNEVKSVLEEQALTEWLIANAPEWQWPGYYLENGEIKFDPERLNPPVVEEPING